MSKFEFGEDRLREVAKDAFMFAARRRATTLNWEGSASQKVAEQEFKRWWKTRQNDKP